MKKIEIEYLINLYDKIILQATDKEEKKRLQEHLADLHLKLLESKKFEDSIL